ncbi:hypothetical protein [Orrella sp. 11846]|uniref:hypothetical protein n=1 Tax=Orrella sp. 11846 TaxID=3409913 RepID=UPI003B5BAD5F
MCQVTREEFDQMHTQLTRIQNRLDRIEERLDQMEADTSAMIDMFTALQGGFRVLHMIGRLAKPFGYISAAAVAIAAAWSKFKGGA